MGLHGFDRSGSHRRARVASMIAVLMAASLPEVSANSLLDQAETASAEQLQEAIKAGNVNAVDDVGRTVLMHAAAHNPDPQVIALLVRAGAKVNTRGPRQWTALMMAAYGNTNPAVVDALLAAGANAALRSDARETAADYAQDNDALKGTPTLAKLRAAGR